MENSGVQVSCKDGKFFFKNIKLQKNLPDGSTVSQKISFAQFHGNSSWSHQPLLGFAENESLQETIR